MPSWRLEPSAVKVARWVLRETALGNKCRPPDKAFSEKKANYDKKHRKVSHFIVEFRTLHTDNKVSGVFSISTLTREVAAILKSYLVKSLRSNGHTKPFPNLAAFTILSEQALPVGQPCGLAGTNCRICLVDTI